MTKQSHDFYNVHEMEERVVCTTRTKKGELDDTTVVDF